MFFLVALLYIGVAFLIYLLLMKIKKQHKVSLVVFCTFYLAFVSVIPYLVWFIKFKEIRKKEINYLVHNLSNGSVDRFMKYVNDWGCENTPDAWGQLKGAWRIANESPNISYNKKKELRDCLMLNGLKLYNNEMNIIDNCKN